MKRIIAHRALLDGPDSSLENNPDQIHKAINKGFSVEVDLWSIDNKWVLGHDKPQYEVDCKWLRRIMYYVIIHAKDIITLSKCNMDFPDLNYFYHQEDDCALTSWNYIWQFPRKLAITPQSIVVLPEKTDYSIDELKGGLGVCTDFPFKYKELLK